MRVLFTFISLLLLKATFASPLLVEKRKEKDLTKMTLLGYRAVNKDTANQYNKRHTLVYKRNRNGNGNQLGDGVYLTRRLGDWRDEYICAVFAKSGKFGSTKLKKLWLNHDERESPVREQTIKEVFGEDQKVSKVILVAGMWGSDNRDEDVQMLIPPYFLPSKTDTGKLDIYVKCVRWADSDELPIISDADWHLMEITGF
ncbi:hypothetical protein GGU10DRAFT_343259 [Lentinula aff. detonsa]|uniref:Uncharacterized protein n=1 Tax=Lentinula aff. detonsa TaxID=2804958 RepID=A0AA38U024_9AGAR|nr:hypothetical protein GGU10DRAFT_343259 [Lentinula aff. detonsa]